MLFDIGLLLGFGVIDIFLNVINFMYYGFAIWFGAAILYYIYDRCKGGPRKRKEAELKVKEDQRIEEETKVMMYNFLKEKQEELKKSSL